MTTTVNEPAERLLDEIHRMEQRVLNAGSIEAARMFHDRLDVLRDRYAARHCACCGQRLGEPR